MTVDGSGFTGATRVNIQKGTLKKGVFIEADEDAFKVNDTGTRITFDEPNSLRKIFEKSFGKHPKYILDVRVVVGSQTSPVNAPNDQVTFLGLIVTHVSPSRLPLDNPDPNPIVTVDGDGFTGASRVNIQDGTKNKGVFIEADEDAFKVNDTGTRITFDEPNTLRKNFEKSFGKKPRYTLDVRVVVKSDTSPVNAPYDQVTFYPLWVSDVAPSDLPLTPTKDERIRVDGSGFTGATQVNIQAGSKNKGVFITAADDVYRVNSSGTQITFDEPGDLNKFLTKIFGKHSSYTLDVRVVVKTDISPVNAPDDQITFHR